MLKAIFLTAVSYLTLGWFSSFATGRLLLDDAPLNLPETPEGRVLITGGLADYRGLSFYTEDGRLIRHSNYQLVSTDQLPSLTNRDIGALYDGTFYLTPADDTQNPPTPVLETSNVAFHRIGTGSPPIVTREPKDFAKAEIIFDSPLGPIFLAAGRYRALIAAVIILAGLISSARRHTLLWPWLGCALACYLLTWAVAFQPGLFTNDSIHQLTNATELRFDNIHPPLMALVAAPFLKFFSIGLLINIQAVLGIAGISLLVWQLLRGQETKRRYAVSTVIVCVLCSPLFPFTPYLFTFWKDAWAALVTIWIANILLWVPQSLNARLAALLALFLAILVLTLLRHNSVALAPLWFWVFFMTFNKNFALTKPMSCGLAIALLVPVVLANPAFEKSLHVIKHDSMNQILLLEILEAQRREPQIASVTPFTTTMIIDPLWHYRFNLDRNDQLFGWGTPRIVDKQVGTFDYRVTELRDEYLEAWKRFPISMLLVKIRIFMALLTRPRGPYANGIIENALGLKFKEAFTQTRTAVFWATERVWNSSARLLSLPATHVTLIVIGLLYKRSRTLITRRLRMSLMALWLGLYLVYLLACPSAEYRYIFPAMLLGHALLLSTIFSISFGQQRAPQIKS